MKRLFLPLVAVAVLAGGCAASSDIASSGDRLEGAAPTGTRIKRPQGEDAYGAKASVPDKFDPAEVTRSRDPGLQR